MANCYLENEEYIKSLSLLTLKGYLLKKMIMTIILFLESLSNILLKMNSSKIYMKQQ